MFSDIRRNSLIEIHRCWSKCQVPKESPKWRLYLKSQQSSITSSTKRLLRQKYQENQVHNFSDFCLWSPILAMAQLTRRTSFRLPKWMPDGSYSECHGCKNAFSFFRRKVRVVTVVTYLQASLSLLWRNLLWWLFIKATSNSTI